MQPRIGNWGTRAKTLPGLWLVLALFMISGICLLGVNTALLYRHVNSRLNHLCTAAESAFGQGGQEQLQLLLQAVDLGAGIRMHLLSPTGADLVTGQLRTDLLSKARAYPPLLPRSTPLRIAETYQYVCLVEPPSRAPGPPLGPMLWVMPFVSVLCCTVGTYITFRMRQIESAVNRFGTGQLTTRVPAGSNDAIGRLANAFNQMAERVETVMEAHQRLCADMAHEIRSPLTRLLLAVPPARRGVALAMDRIQVEAARVSDLADQLLCVSRAEVDAQAMERQPVAIAPLLTEITDHAGIEAAERSCEIELVLEDPGTIQGDAELLRRAIENVLRNALRHSPYGERIVLWAGGDPRCVVIAIRDRGAGVPVQALDDIFRPFYRVDPGRDRSQGGAGLGLAIAQRAIALHGGIIHAENCAPGLRITIELPRLLHNT
jgi:signal transduction histidine kinase